MTELELKETRRHKWRQDGNPARTEEAAAEFLESVGFCLLYAEKGLPPLATLVGAYAGSGENLPGAAQAFADERARAATELAVALLRRRAAFESNAFGDNTLLLAPSLFPYFFAVAGERNPAMDMRAAKAKLSPLAGDTLEFIRQQGRISKRRVRETLGGAPSGAALDRALAELSKRLWITRVDYNRDEGASWDLMARWAPEAVDEGVRLSVGESLSALVSRYLDSVVAAEAREVEEFLGLLVPRSRVRESVNALQAARELEYVPVDGRTMLRLVVRREEIHPKRGGLGGAARPAAEKPRS